MAGRPKTRAKRELEQRKQDPNDPAHPRYQFLADIYAEKYDTFNALRQAMVRGGIVEHGINPYEVIQRAIDDTTTDYLLLRRRIDKDTKGDPHKLMEHPLYEYMEHIREAMVRYSTFAMQYDIQKRQLKLSETRVALLADTLRTAGRQLGLTHDQIRQLPQLLIQTIKDKEPGTPSKYVGPQKLDANKAEALAEILHNDTEVEIIDQPEDIDASNGHHRNGRD